MNSCHSWCFTHKSRGGTGGFGYFCLQPRQTRIFPVIKVRMKGLVLGYIVGVTMYQWRRNNRHIVSYTSCGWMLTCVALSNYLVIVRIQHYLSVAVPVLKLSMTCLVCENCISEVPWIPYSLCQRAFQLQLILLGQELFQLKLQLLVIFSSCN